MQVDLGRHDLDFLMQALDLEVVNKERLRDRMPDATYWDRLTAQLVALKALQKRLRTFAYHTGDCESFLLQGEPTAHAHD